ncbi:MAG: redoxin domain-containing protein [Planctomycetes bacterium]|nr:redoxin domain-containing protein [Planctomycetota bacterium]
MTVRRAAALAFAALCGLLACSGGGAEPGPRLAAADGTVHAPLVRAQGAVHVVVFVSHECPIANAYAPTLRELAAAWAGQPVRLYLVLVDPDLSPAAAAAHAQQYELPGTLLLDPHHELATALAATRTPEAFVLGAAGLVYRGRIDDQWHNFGARAQAANRHELRDAVAAALGGRTATVARTDAVGCLLPEPRR